MDVIALKDIKPGLKNINVIFIVLEVGSATVTKENREVRNFKVGDPTACINVSIWDEPGKLIAPGDIVKLTKGYASIWRHCLTLYSGKNGEVFKIGDFCMIFNEQLNMSEPIPIRSEPQPPTAQIMGNVSSVQALPAVNAATVAPAVPNKAGNLPLAAAAAAVGGVSTLANTKTTQAASTPTNTKTNRGRGNSARGGGLKGERR